jgi:hypothetical protein
MEKTVNIGEKQAVLRKKLLDLMSKKNMKAAEVSRITGRSEGTVSDILNNKKSFSNELLNAFYESFRDYMGDRDLVVTRQYNKIWNVAKSGKQQSDMRLVVGNTGIGKSIVLKKFAEENECCYYIKIDNKDITWNQFLLKISSEMGVRHDKLKRKTSSYLLGRIQLFIESNADRKPQIIIDESEHAPTRLFKDLKGLYTKTEGLLSIVVVGITGMMDRIGRIAGLEVRTYQVGDGYSYRWYPKKENSNVYTTFARRISVFRIDNISTDDIAAFCLEKQITNKKVIELASSRWWNYDEADRAIKRALRMGLNLATLAPNEFELL